MWSQHPHLNGISAARWNFSMCWLNDGTFWNIDCTACGKKKRPNKLIECRISAPSLRSDFSHTYPTNNTFVRRSRFALEKKKQIKIWLDNISKAFSRVAYIALCLSGLCRMNGCQMLVEQSCCWECFQAIAALLFIRFAVVVGNRMFFQVIHEIDVLCKCLMAIRALIWAENERENDE